MQKSSNAGRRVRSPAPTIENLKKFSAVGARVGLNYDPTEMAFCTLYRSDDNAEVEQEESYDPSGKTKIHDAAHKKFCKCGKSSWWNNRPGWSMESVYTCEDCDTVTCDDGLVMADFTNYDGSQEREY